MNDRYGRPLRKGSPVVTWRELKTLGKIDPIASRGRVVGPNPTYTGWIIIELDSGHRWTVLPKDVVRM